MLTPQQARTIASDLFRCIADGDGPESGASQETDDKWTEPEPIAAPEFIGPYRIRRVIAAGGMGTVYEAEQEHPRRIVAVKVLRRDLVSRSALRRFQYETEVLARLRHPGIAQIYEAGTHDDGTGGVPYFVMEHIENAQPITQFTREHKLDLRQRLELFAQVCDAVSYGHQNRIIHRDLKPGNILVGEEVTKTQRHEGAQDETDALRASAPCSLRAFPKIIDFGIACATDADVTLTTLHTDSRTLIGTLQYMSPEQATGGSARASEPARVEPATPARSEDKLPLPWGEDRGEGGHGVPLPAIAMTAARPLTPNSGGSPDGRVALDTRSDIYSLGVILYELVCGQLPYDLSKMAIAHAARIIDETDPPRPSTICKVFRIRRDLEAIILKAMEKDRRRRYQTAAALADDLRRYLRGEPVEAKAPSRWTRAVKWVGRHPVIATTAFCVTIIVISTGATAIGLWLASLRPARFLIPPLQSNVAYLQTMAGRHLATLGGSDDSHVIFAAISERPAVFGGGRAALFCVNGTTGEHLTRGQLFVTALTDLSRVHWSTRADSSYIATPEPVGSPHDQYTAYHLLLADVFDDPEYPGDEIVVNHLSVGHPGSPCAIRAYDWRGQVLFEAWHMGPVKGMVWLSGPWLLVWAGDRHGIDWAKANEWVGRNQADLPIKFEPGDYPMVLFALRPILNKRVGWLAYGKSHDEASGLNWYRCIHPLTNRSKGDKSTRPSLYMFSFGSIYVRSESSVDITVEHITIPIGVGLQVGGDGTLQAQNPGDPYRAAEVCGEAPLPSTAFTIGDFPFEICESLEETKARWDKDRPE